MKLKLAEKNVKATLLASVLWVSTTFSATTDSLSPEFIRGIMRTVVDTYYTESPGHGWRGGTYWDGVMAAYEALGDEKYLEWTNAWGDAGEWGIGTGNGACQGHAMLKAYIADPAEYKIENIRDKYGSYLAGSSSDGYRAKRYKIVDLLFMEPPVWGILGHIENERGYWNALWTKVEKTMDTLYDFEEHLFYRDLENKWPNRKTANGKKVFWSRGVGWAVGGVTEVLHYMDTTDSLYPKFATLFTDMCAALKEVQQPDGFWRSSLADPEEYTDPETSGTAFFCFGFAWGVNRGLLPAEEYREPAEMAWKACASKVADDGYLYCSQWDGSDPRGSNCDNRPTDYATGAFLLAGNEMIKLAESTTSVAQPTVTRSGASRTGVVQPTVTIQHRNGAVRPAYMMNGRAAFHLEKGQFVPVVEVRDGSAVK